MSNDEILIIYRQNNFYKDITDFISNFTDINEYGISLHNFTNEILDETIFTTVVNYDVSNSESSISDTIKFFYNDNLNNYCLVFDSCIKYESPIILKNLLYSEDTFIKIQGGPCDIFFILGKTIHRDNTNIILNYNCSSKESNIVLSGTIDSAVLNNLCNNEVLYTYILRYILDIEFDSDKLKSLPLQNSEEYYKTFLQVLIGFPGTYTIELLQGLLNNEAYNKNALYLLLRHIDDQSDFIIDDSLYNNILDKIEDLQDVENVLGLLDFRGEYNEKKCVDFIIKYSLNKTFIDIYSIPEWCCTDSNKSITKHYPTLTEGEPIKINAPYKIDKNITLLSKDIYGLDDNILNIKRDKIILNEEEFKFDNKNGISVLYSDEVIYLYTQTNPVMIYSISEDNTLEIVEDGIFSYGVPGYKLIGNIVMYMGLNMGLVRVKNGSYRLLLLDSHMLDCIEISKNFNISKGIAIGLCVEENNIYILSESTEGEESILYKQKICSGVLFLEITNIFNLPSCIELKISDKNNIFLDVSDWNHDTYVYENFIFSRETNYDIKASYNPQTQILIIDDKIKYKKEFIYFPDNTLDDSDKTHELYFDPSAKETLLYEKTQELNISTSENYNNAKYFVIDQTKFELLTSLELSDIINNNTLIISLIDGELLRNNTLVNNYTTSKLLTKLFLFNIVKNDTYVEFIFDKIIHKEEYNDRKDFINVDKENIFKEASIYKNIVDLYKSSDSINIELSDKDSKLCTLIKSKILNKVDPDIYKNILNICKFIIVSNYNIDILFNNGQNTCHRKIYDILIKLNWLGNIYTDDINNGDENKRYNIIIINTQKEMSNIKLKDNGLIYISESNILLKI